MMHVEFVITSTGKMHDDEIKNALRSTMKSTFDQRLFDVADIDHNVDYWMGIDVKHEYYVRVII
jgi:hypothetical protein